MKVISISNKSFLYISQSLFLKIDCLFFIQGKMKKMKEKYGDQDDEEKEERMALLQVR